MHGAVSTMLSIVHDLDVEECADIHLDSARVRFDHPFRKDDRRKPRAVEHPVIGIPLGHLTNDAVDRDQRFIPERFRKTNRSLIT